MEFKDRAAQTAVLQAQQGGVRRGQYTDVEKFFLSLAGYNTDGTRNEWGDFRQGLASVDIGTYGIVDNAIEMQVQGALRGDEGDAMRSQGYRDMQARDRELQAQQYMNSFNIMQSIWGMAAGGGAGGPATSAGSGNQPAPTDAELAKDFGAENLNDAYGDSSVNTAYWDEKRSTDYKAVLLEMTKKEAQAQADFEKGKISVFDRDAIIENARKNRAAAQRRYDHYQSLTGPQGDIGATDTAATNYMSGLSSKEEKGMSLRSADQIAAEASKNYQSGTGSDITKYMSGASGLVGSIGSAVGNAVQQNELSASKDEYIRTYISNLKRSLQLNDGEYII